MLGREHLDTFCRFNTFGTILKEWGKLGDAEVMLRRVMEGCKSVLGTKLFGYIHASAVYRSKRESARARAFNLVHPQAFTTLALIWEDKASMTRRKRCFGSVWK